MPPLLEWMTPRLDAVALYRFLGSGDTLSAESSDLVGLLTRQEGEDFSMSIRQQLQEINAQLVKVPDREGTTDGAFYDRVQALCPDTTKSVPRRKQVQQIAIGRPNGITIG